MPNTVLIIAERLPRFQCNSGDLRLMEIIRIMAKEKRLIYASLSKMSDGSDVAGLMELNQLGVEVVIEEFDLRSVMSRNDLDFIFIEFYKPAEYFLPRIRILNPLVPIVIDSVDVHYHREASLAMLTRNQEDLLRAQETKRRETRIYSLADVVITITDEDTRVLLGDNPGINTHVIPNIHRLLEQPRGPRIDSSLVFVGGFQHPPNVDAMQYFCKEIMPLLHEKRPEVSLYIIGSYVPDEIRAFGNDHINIIGFVPSVSQHLLRHAISVAPLRYGAGMKGKVGEAMAHGLPVVTTPTGIQGVGVEDRVHVMVANSPDKFVSCIIELLDSESLYNEISANALEFVRTHYTPDPVSKDIQALYDKVGSTRVRPLPLHEAFHFWRKYLWSKVSR